MKLHSKRASGGFTLLEILVVVVIIGIMAAIAVPMMRAPARAGQIQSSANQFKSELLLARQQALTLNGSVEVKFFKETTTAPYTAYQIFNIKDDNTLEPYSELKTFPEGLGLPADAELCPLLEESLLTGIQTDGVPLVRNWTYAAFNIRSSGQLENFTEDKAFVTLVDIKAPKVSGKLPANYAVIKMQPQTGMISVTQP